MSEDGEKPNCNLIIFKSKKNHVTYLMNQARQVFYTKESVV